MNSVRPRIAGNLSQNHERRSVACRDGERVEINRGMYGSAQTGSRAALL